MKFKKYLFKSVKSTNDIAIKKIKEGIPLGLIIAKKQTKGRGRYGNKWIYLKNNLFMSVFFNLSNNINLRKLTSISCKIVKKSLLKLLNKKITIKKPNDLLINKKKVCGILQETVFFKNKKFAIIGIGINIDRSPAIGNYPTTYLNFFSKKKITSFKIYNEIKKNFEIYLNK
jgi:BirA family biotin operon repressor/biotin-[acetyl-CoA-carboxylase] ligase|tara:strand:- start:288 stop:803 length:516 start_codon:yes stop_codon:yes gene_type:complete